MSCKQQTPVLGFLGFLLVVCCHTGCGTPAAPLPPSLQLPTPVLNLSALRVGDDVHLSWTMPTRTTDKVPLHNPVMAQVCRAVQDAPCTPIANLSLAPGVAGAYTDALPADLAQGADRLLRYEVAVRNRAGKSAGPSNAAYSAAGRSPAAFRGLTGQVRADGVELAWAPIPLPGRPLTFRIERLETSASATEPRPKSPLAPPNPAVAETLAVHSQDGADPGHAIDASALFNRQYRYTMERVATLVLPGQSVEVQGLPSEPILVTTTDRFAPAVPIGLAAVADVAAGAIDLSWAPDTESDLAEYHVYRRDAPGAESQSIAIVRGETSFRDTRVQPGHTYAYSISATDQSKNESHRSAEVEETLPAK